MLELYLSSKLAYSYGISGVSGISVVLNNDGDKKQAEFQILAMPRSIYTNEVSMSMHW